MQRIQKTIQEFLSDESLPSVSPDDTVTAAATTMKEKQQDCCLVLQDGVLVGIFTERDFLYRVTADKRNPDETKISEVMTARPQTLRAQDSIAYAINRMVVRGFRNVPIVDDAGKPISVLDVRDVMAHLNDVFGEVAEGGGQDQEWDEWTDIGGGA